MTGGLCNDSYFVYSLVDKAVEAASQRTDTIVCAFNFSLAAIANFENLTLTGTASLHLHRQHAQQRHPEQ